MNNIKFIIHNHQMIFIIKNNHATYTVFNFIIFTLILNTLNQNLLKFTPDNKVELLL